MGVGTTIIASLMHNRKSVGAEIEEKYIKIAKKRIQLLQQGQLRIRPLDQPIYQPKEEVKNSHLHYHSGENSLPFLVN